MTLLESTLKDLLRSGKLTNGQAVAIIGCCDLINSPPPSLDIIKSKFTVEYGQRAVDGLTQLLTEERCTPSTT